MAQILAACIDVLALSLATQLERQAGDTSRLSDNQGIAEDMAIMTLDSAHQTDLQPRRPILTKQQQDDLNNELLDACIEGDEVKVIECLDNGPQVNVPVDENAVFFDTSCSILHVACNQTAFRSPEAIQSPFASDTDSDTPCSKLWRGNYIAPLVQPSSLLAAANFPNDNDPKVSEALASCRFRVRGYGLYISGWMNSLANLGGRGIRDRSTELGDSVAMGMTTPTTSYS